MMPKAKLVVAICDARRVCWPCTRDAEPFVVRACQMLARTLESCRPRPSFSASHHHHTPHLAKSYMAATRHLV